jgi:hypothetical protein
MSIDYIVVLLKNLEERKRLATLKKARQMEIEARRSLKHHQGSERGREAQEFEEWGRRNSASIAAALERNEGDEWN